jgi:hypothetical protein
VGCGTHVGELPGWCLPIFELSPRLACGCSRGKPSGGSPPRSGNDGLMVSARSSPGRSSTGSTPRSRASRANLEAPCLAAAGLRVVERTSPASAGRRREASRGRRTPVAQPRARVPGPARSARPRAQPSSATRTTAPASSTQAPGRSGDACGAVPQRRDRRRSRIQLLKGSLLTRMSIATASCSRPERSSSGNAPLAPASAYHRLIICWSFTGSCAARSCSSERSTSMW